MRYALLMLPAFLSLSADAADHAPQQADLKALQGLWILKTVEQCGVITNQDGSMSPLARRSQRLWSLPEERELLPQRLRDEYRTTLVIAGDRFFFHQQGRVSAKGQFKLETTKVPKVIERNTVSYRYHFHDHSFSIHSKEGTYHSIYKVEGGVLTWCQWHNGDRKHLPSEFATGDDEDILLLTFHRER